MSPTFTSPFSMPSTTIRDKMMPAIERTLGKEDGQTAKRFMMGGNAPSIINHAVFRTLVKELGNPIVSTSIRDDDDILEYTTDPELIFEKWNNLVDVVIDDGYGGNEGSTIVDLTDSYPEVIREGKGSLDIL